MPARSFGERQSCQPALTWEFGTLGAPVEPWELPPACDTPIGSAGTSCSLWFWSCVLSLSSLFCCVSQTRTLFSTCVCILLWAPVAHKTCSSYCAAQRVKINYSRTSGQGSWPLAQRIQLHGVQGPRDFRDGFLQTKQAPRSPIKSASKVSYTQKCCWGKLREYTPPKRAAPQKLDTRTRTAVSNKHLLSQCHKTEPKEKTGRAIQTADTVSPRFQP